ncbi:uncharacterized protein V6R79_024104 [Siganus canaliculatus]
MAVSFLKWLKRWLFRAFMEVLLVIFQLLSRPRPGIDGEKLPPVRNPLLLQSATQLAKKIRRKEVSSVEVVQAYIDRIQEINHLLNVVVKHRFDAALQEAALADKQIMEACGEEELEDKPFLGVPFSVKESLSLKGMPLTTGVVSRKHILAKVDGQPVDNMKKAGAIPIGVTNTSELCMYIESHNHLYGISNNPYDLTRTVGGSSGGEGGVLGGAGAVIGMGSDIGGSIRLPAFFNGIFGHKTTPDVISTEDKYPPSSGRRDEYSSIGPMCRYAEDLLPMLKIMAGSNAHMLSLDKKVDLKKLRFFTIVDDGGSSWAYPVTRELVDVQRKVVERLEADLGVKVQEVQFPELQYSIEIWDTFMGLPDKDGKPPLLFAEMLGEPGKPLKPAWELLKRIVGKSDHTVALIGMALFEKAERDKPSDFIIQQKEKLQNKLEDLLGSDGVLLYPSYTRVVPKHHHPLFRLFDSSYTGIFNILGLPVTQCPLGLNDKGLPLGVQVVGWKYQDRLPLEVALHLEKAFGGWREPGTPEC